MKLKNNFKKVLFGSLGLFCAISAVPIILVSCSSNKVVDVPYEKIIDFNSYDKVTMKNDQDWPLINVKKDTDVYLFYVEKEINTVDEDAFNQFVKDAGLKKGNFNENNNLYNQMLHNNNFRNVTLFEKLIKDLVFKQSLNIDNNNIDNKGKELPFNAINPNSITNTNFYSTLHYDPDGKDFAFYLYAKESGMVPKDGDYAQDVNKLFSLVINFVSNK